MITAQQLHAIEEGISPTSIDLYLNDLNKAMIAYYINTRLRQCAFIAHLIHETACLSKMRENMNYSAQGLMNTFPKYFNKFDALAYERKPEMIANRAYASRMGNGNEKSGDGWAYRGGGGLHATGRDMYKLLSKELSLDLEKKPELIVAPEVAMMSAGYIWAVVKGCNEKADVAGIDSDPKSRTCGIPLAMKKTTIAINGGFNGLKERVEIYNRALKVIK